MENKDYLSTLIEQANQGSTQSTIQLYILLICLAIVTLLSVRTIWYSVRMFKKAFTKGLDQKDNMEMWANYLLILTTALIVSSGYLFTFTERVSAFLYDTFC